MISNQHYIQNHITTKKQKKRRRKIYLFCHHGAVGKRTSKKKRKKKHWINGNDKEHNVRYNSVRKIITKLLIGTLLNGRYWRLSIVCLSCHGPNDERRISRNVTQR